MGFMFHFMIRRISHSAEGVFMEMGSSEGCWPTTSLFKALDRGIPVSALGFDAEHPCGPSSRDQGEDQHVEQWKSPERCGAESEEETQEARRPAFSCADFRN